MNTPEDRPGAISPDLDIAPAEAEAIERHIASADSPVGIDAKLTHVLILHKLIEIEKRLARLEVSGRSSR